MADASVQQAGGPGSGGSAVRLLGSTTELAAAADAGESGAIWRLEPADRHLDANVIALPPGDAIADHVGPDEDVLLHVLAGSGVLRSGSTEVGLTEGAIVWLPRRSRRAIEAGPDGLRYFSVHRRKGGLQIGATHPN
ncbi:cupin domain-containing protein [Agrococcus beijingensis]|uniref:cupin domain-containing protein n=1 Tax=Agrococcus beijingensis TaxID=3068634 RepID=UPI0027412E3D|nr:cupin [Agrococcus sp. REN33]